MRLFLTTICIIAVLGLLGCGETPPKMERHSIEGFVRAVEINRCPNWYGSDIVAVGFEDGRVKFFYKSIPDMVKQGSNNKISFKRIFNDNGSFWDQIEGITTYPAPKEPK
jgi:hypothetical protein